MTSSQNSINRKETTQLSSKHEFEPKTITLLAHENECNRLIYIIKWLICCLMLLIFFVIGLFLRVL